MRSTLTLLCTFTYVLIGLLSGGVNLEAQEVKKFLRDYRDERVFKYSPTDPNYRGKVFRIHTGHYGAFYNCDGEENKRNSQYICWKPHHERDFPPRLGFCENLRRDIAEVKQRINDGGCGTCAQNCTCPTCQRAAAAAVQNTCSCVDCAGQTQAIHEGTIGIPPLNSSQEFSTQQILPGQLGYARQKGFTNQHAEQVAPANQTAEKLNYYEANKTTPRRDMMNSKYGLVSGKIIGTQDMSLQTSTAATNAAIPTEPNTLHQARQAQAEVRKAQINSRNATKLDFWNSLKRR